MATRRDFLAASFSMTLLSAAHRAQTVYLGTYTRGESKGIYQATFDQDSGIFSAPTLAAEVESPSFLALHPNRRFLYSISEASGRGSFVTSYSISDTDGKLTRLNQAETGGDGGCHLVVDRKGQALAVAHYGSGSTALLPLTPAGQIGEKPQVIAHSGKGPDVKRQEKPHAHGVFFTPDQRYLCVPDLGTDQVIIYRFQPKELTAHTTATVPPGSGPRHLVFHPSKEYAYVVNEMKSSVTAFRYDKDAGTLTSFQTLPTLPAGFTGESSCAEIAVHPRGKFLYASNRGHDSVTVFAIGTDGSMTVLESVPTQGKNPRNFALSPNGRFLLAANQDGNNVVPFSIDASTGRLKPIGSPVAAFTPVCLLFR